MLLSRHAKVIYFLIRISWRGSSDKVSDYISDSVLDACLEQDLKVVLRNTC